MTEAAEPDAELREAIARRSNIKPTGRKFSGVSQQGDGDWCPVEGHGRKYRLDGRQWCPHQSHDMGVPRDATGPHSEAPAE